MGAKQKSILGLWRSAYSHKRTLKACANVRTRSVLRYGRHPSEAARSVLESPQDLANQVWGTGKSAIPYTWTGAARHVCEQTPIDRQFSQYGRSWRDPSGSPTHFCACQRRSKKGPPWRRKKGPLGGCGLVPVVHGRAPRAARRALNRLTRRRAREGPVGLRGQAWAGWLVQFAVGV